MADDPAPRARFARWAPFVAAALVAPVAAFALLARAPDDGGVLKRPLAPVAESDAWTEDGLRRGRPLEDFPDPPGEGPVVRAHYWVSLPAYEMEVRRRGHRLTLGIRGTDVQVAGGAWIAFAEGSVTGEPSSFRGASARIVWSCVGLRYRAATDGVARLDFSRDGDELVAVYLQGYEALRTPVADTYVMARGRRARGPRPAYGDVVGQVPFTGKLRRHADDAVVTLSGRVLDLDGVPVADALVQLKGRDATRVHADAQGRFRLRGSGRDAPWTQSVCAGAADHRNGETVLFTGDPTDEVVVELARLDPVDHRDYAWVHPAPDRDGDSVSACGTCHSWQYTEWLGSRHARMADHGHVLHERERMRRRAPDAPDDCAACHQPALAATAGAVPYQSRGVLAGNHCDFCHKVRHVDDVRKPGVLGSLVLGRPDPTVRDRPGDVHRVYGPAPDVSYAYMGASWNPTLSTSFLCAGCHEGGGLPGRPKLETFSEWRSWAAAREDERFRSCQDCHMPGGATQTDEGAPVDLFAWESLHRSPASVHSHAFPGSGASFSKDAIALEVEKRFDATRGRWLVAVKAAARGVGHRVPTGTWTKHVAIGVWARQGDRWLAADGGERARLVDDDAAPAGPLAGGDWRNPPGTVLGMLDAQGRPADFWDPPAAAALRDTRLAPDETRRLEVAFVPEATDPAAEPVVEVRVVHRRGAIGEGLATTPWTRRPYDPPPQVEWTRIVR